MAAGNSKRPSKKGPLASRPKGGGEKFNTGKRGGPRTKLSQSQLFMMGKGKFAKMPEGHKNGGWSGIGEVSRKFDPVQAVKNRQLGFTGEAPYPTAEAYELALNAARSEARKNKVAA